MNWAAVSTVLVAIVGLGIVALFVSKSSNTSSVIQSSSTGFATILGAAANIGGSGTGGLLSNSAGIWT